MSLDLDAAAQVYREAARNAVRRHSVFYLIEAALLVAAGVFAILFPVFSSAAVVLMFGWLLIVSGVVQILGLLGARHAPNFWLQLISVVLGILIGVLILRNIGQGMVIMSLLLIVFFMMEGISKIVFSLTIRPLSSWFWVFASGLLAVGLSILLWASMPTTALWLIGLMLGVNLISAGLSIGALAWTGRKSPRNAGASS